MSAVEAICPRIEIENRLQRDVEAGNQRLAGLREHGRPLEEIEKVQRELQSEINAKSLNCGGPYSADQILRGRIAAAVVLVAKERNLNVVVDRKTVNFGNDLVMKCGEDITDHIIRNMR